MWCKTVIAAIEEEYRQSILENTSNSDGRLTSTWIVSLPYVSRRLEVAMNQPKSSLRCSTQHYTQYCWLWISERSDFLIAELWLVLRGLVHQTGWFRLRILPLTVVFCIPLLRLSTTVCVQFAGSWTRTVPRIQVVYCMRTPEGRIWNHLTVQPAPKKCIVGEVLITRSRAWCLPLRT